MGTLTDAQVLRSKRRFMGRWLQIENKGASGTIAPFNRPSKAQLEALEALCDVRVKLLVFLKSRQVYMSTVNAGSFFHDHCRARGPLRTMVACDTGDTTDSLLRKHKTFAENLPGRIQPQLNIRVNHNKHEIQFGRNGGMLKLATVGGRSLGKSQTYQNLIAEEMAFWPNENEAWASITSAISDEGRKVIISTPNGPGGKYEEQVNAAFQEDRIHNNPAVRFFFWAWFEHPEYRRTPPPHWQPMDEEVEYGRIWKLDKAQLYWRHWKIYGPEGVGLAKFRKFYPTTMEEGFLSFEGGWFDVGWLNTQIGVYKNVSKKGLLRIYRKPTPGMAYAIGADPSWCNGGHYAAAVVLDERGRLCAVLSMKSHPDGEIGFAKRLSRIAGYYNRARILCESNKGGGGHNVIRYLRKERCRLWVDPDTGKDWHTSRGTKTDAYSHARQMINGDALEIPDLQVLRELSRIREVNGRISNPQEGSGDRDDTKDDHADALVLAEYNRRTLPRAPRLELKRYRRKLSVIDDPHGAVSAAF